MLENLAQIDAQNYLPFELKILLAPIGLNATFNFLAKINRNNWD